MCRFIALTAAVLATSMIHVSSSHGQTAAAPWPTQPIRMVVPFAPGGSNDVIARRLAQRLTESLGQSVVVENRAGAGSTIGSGYVANAKPDGYTFLLNSNSLATTAAVQKLSYSAIESLVPITMVASAPLVVVSRTGFVDSMDKLIAFAKANPGKLNYGTAGVGDTNHLATEMLNLTAGIAMQSISYKGMAPAQIDLVAGRLDLMITTMASILGTQADSLPKLAFTGATRNPAYPSVPTVKEATGLDYTVGVWWGVFAPAGLPSSIQMPMNNAIRSVIAEPEFAAFIKSLGATPEGSTPDVMHSVLKNDIDRFTEAAERAGIRDK